MRRAPFSFLLRSRRRDSRYHYTAVGTPPRLCVVSRERVLRWAELMVVLRQTLSPQDELRIIIDRRNSRPSTEAPPEPADRPSVERRRHQHVDVALTVDGFAIVPESASGRPLAHVPTLPSPTETSVLGDAEVEDAERSVDDAEPPRRIETPARAASPRMPNPRIQRLYPEEPRDEPLDDAGVDAPPGSVDAAEPRQRSDSGPRLPQPRIASPRTPSPRIPRSWHRDEPRHGRSRAIWVVTGLVAVLVLLALLVVGQTIGAFKVRTVPDRPSAVQTREPLTAPPDPAPDSGTDKPASLTPSPGAERAREAEPAPAEGSRAPVELPARPRPQPTLEAGAEQRRQAGSQANTPSSTMVGRPAAASRTFSGLPRAELIRSPAPTSSGSGETYIVRISDTAGRPLPEVEASLVGHMSDGSGLSIPLEPGPEPGTYHATIPLGRPLRDLRVRIVTSDTRFEIPLGP